MGDPLPSLGSCPICLWESDPPKWTGGNDYAVYSKVLSQPTEPGSVLNKAGTWIIDCQTSNLPQVSTQMPPFQWRSSYSTLFTMANPFPVLFFSIVLIAIRHTLYFTPPRHPPAPSSDCQQHINSKGQGLDLFRSRLHSLPLEHCPAQRRLCIRFVDWINRGYRGFLINISTWVSKHNTLVENAINKLWVFVSMWQ